jgi:hypothetical protein
MGLKPTAVGAVGCPRSAGGDQRSVGAEHTGSGLSACVGLVWG